VSVNRGEPVVLAQPRSEFTRAIAGLVKQLSPATSPARKAAHRRRLLSFARA
jgi:MinD-like ATPase involved in chromosome partitioning or flagellar assembly